MLSVLTSVTMMRGTIIGLVTAMAVAGSQISASAESAELEPLNTVDAALAAVSAEPAVVNPEASTPTEGDDSVVLEGASGTVEFDLPAEGEGGLQSDGLTTIFASDDPSAHVAVQPVENGVRALVVLADSAASDHYGFPVGGDVVDLQIHDGSAVGYDAEGNPVATAAVPWAVDAHGEPVPTHFEVRGTTLVQVVDHRDGDYAYPITADPVWAAVIAAAGACATSALISVPTTALLDVHHGKASSRRTDIENAVVSCLVPGVGTFAWRILPTSTKKWAVSQVLRFVLWLGPRSRF